MRPGDIKPSVLAAAGMAAVLAVGVYVNTLDNPFVYDDRIWILENESIRDLGNLEAIIRFSPTRPLVNISYALDYARSGLGPRAYHATNITLHVVNVLLLFALAGRLAVRLPGSSGPAESSIVTLTAFTAATLFAVHPMMTEAVGYVSSRSELLGGALFLASVLAFLSGLDSRPGRARTAWLAAGWALFVLSLAAREIAVMLPFVLLAYDLLRAGAQPNSRRITWAVHGPLFAVVLLGGSWRVWTYMAVEHPEAAGIQWQHVLVQLDVFVKYLRLLVVPVGQSLVQPVSPVTSVLDVRVLTAALVIGLLAAAAVAWRHRLPLMWFGAIWYVVLQAPAAALMLLADKGQPMAEHRIYLASGGLFLAAGALAAHVAGGSRIVRGRLLTTSAMLAAAVIALSALTVARNRVWRDPVALWEDALRKAPDTFAAQYGVGYAHFSSDNCVDATPAFERAMALQPDEADPYLGLAQCYARVGRLSEVRRVLGQGIEEVDGDAELRLALAAIEEAGGRFGEALRVCEALVEREPGEERARACVERMRRRLGTR